MNYTPIPLVAPLYGISVNKPVDRPDIAVVQGLTQHYDVARNLRPVMGELKQSGVENAVIDLSDFPEGFKGSWLMLLDDILVKAGHNTRYIGIEQEEAGRSDPLTKRDTSKKIAGSLDTAVESFEQ